MFKLVGVDVYLNSSEIPDIPREHGPLKLTFISNRGMRVWPGPTPKSTLLDMMRCRYEGETVTDAEIEQLLTSLSEGSFVWAKAQKLYELDGERQYSQPY